MKRLRENPSDERREYESEWKALKRMKKLAVPDCSTSSLNGNKNRYSDILANNCSRVILSYAILFCYWCLF
jgi:protein tyrosine phosphatase